MVVSGLYEPELTRENKDNRPAARVMGNMTYKF